MYKVGITGLIGSGKTTVCHIFEILDIPVFYADDEAKRIMLKDLEVKEALVNVLGKQTYTPDGVLDRNYVSAQIFKDESLLTKVNQIVHPRVLASLDSWFSSHQDKPYVLYESALIQAKHRTFLDKIILVTAPKLLRLERVLQRQKTTRKAVLERMAAQVQEKDLKKLADFTIRNDGRPLLRQVISIHQQLCSSRTKLL